MTIYDEIVNEYEFDPFAPGPVTEPWQPWTIQGALEVLGMAVQGVPEPVFVEPMTISIDVTEDGHVPEAFEVPS